MKRSTRRLVTGTALVSLAAGSLIALSSAQAAPTVTPVRQARATVLSAVPGKVLSITKKTRSGFKAWAITVKRTDGSVVVGYVDVKSGIVFDWTVKAAPGELAVDLDGNDAVLEPAEPPKPLPSPTPTPSATPTPSPTPTATPAAPSASTPAPAAAPAATATTSTLSTPATTRPSATATTTPTASASPTPGVGRGDGVRGDGTGQGRPPRDGGQQGAPGAAAPAPAAEPVVAAPAPPPARPPGGDGGGRGGGRRSFTPPAG